MTYARNVADGAVKLALEDGVDIVDSVEATVMAVIQRCAMEAESHRGYFGLLAKPEDTAKVIADRIRALATTETTETPKEDGTP